MCRVKVNLVRAPSVQALPEESEVVAPSFKTNSSKRSSMKDASNTPVTSYTDGVPVYSLGIIGAVETSGKVWLIPLLTNETMTSYKVDARTEVSRLPKAIYNKLQQKAEWRPSRARLLPYGSTAVLPVDKQCVYHVPLENGRALSALLRGAFPGRTIIPGLGACEYLGLISEVAAVQEDKGSREPVLEGSNISDWAKIQADSIAWRV